MQPVFALGHQHDESSCMSLDVAHVPMWKCDEHGVYGWDALCSYVGECYECGLAGWPTVGHSSVRWATLTWEEWIVPKRNCVVVTGSVVGHAICRVTGWAPLDGLLGTCMEWVGNLLHRLKNMYCKTVRNHATYERINLHVASRGLNILRSRSLRFWCSGVVIIVFFKRN